MIKLVALDLDGTVLNKEGKISEQTQMTIEKVLKKGIKVVLCTGRNLPLAVEYTIQLGLSSYLVTCNGAEIRKVNGEQVQCWPMELEQLDLVISVLQKHDALFELYGDDFIYFESKEKHSSKYLNYMRYYRGDSGFDEAELRDELKKSYYQETGSFQQFLKDQNPLGKKFYVMGSDESRLAALFEELKSIPDLTLTASHRSNIEINHLNATKGNALAHLSQMLGFLPQEVAAIGDGENDISMFQFCGLSIAMGNANEIVKQSADVVTVSNHEEGVSHALEKWVL